MKVFDYLKLSALKRAKYDNSITAIVLPKEEELPEGNGETPEEELILNIVGERDNPQIEYNPKHFDYEKFSFEIEKMENSTQTGFQRQNYVTFLFRARGYIGVAQFSEVGIRKNFDRKSNELVNPIFIIADRSDEFFFMINRVRNVFIILLTLVFAGGLVFKVYNTIVVTKEIKGISDRMASVTSQINQNGVIGGKLKEFITKFFETSNLDHSFVGLVKSLEDLGNIISGIADRDLLVATLKNDNSVLNPHDEMMAVIFLDIQGFTTISEKHKDDIMSIVNHIWLEVEGIIGPRYGKINKYEGDACLIIFRDADNKGPIHTALNAFYSGIQLLEVVSKICKDLDIDFNFRVGIDYGKVTYGKTGTDNNFELGVIGDPVNTAARLEALNKQYNTNLLITDGAFNHTKLGVTKEHNPKDEIKKDINIKCVVVDKARPKGKKEAKELFTILKNKDNNYAFIGSEHAYPKKQFEIYEALANAFRNSIAPWQKYHEYKTKNSIKEDNKESLSLRNQAEQHWSDLARKFAQFHMQTKFPPAEHFTKTLLKFEEYDEFLKDPNTWLKKDIYKVKSPSEEWIKLGTIELSK